MSRRPNGGVLERNVALLIQRAYVPAAPRPVFRAELQRSFLDALERRRAVARAERGLWHSPLTWVAAAAALLLALLAGRGFLAGGRQPDARALVARGEVALRLADEPWRAATPAERARGVDLTAPLSVALPTDATLALRAGDGRALLEGPARASFDTAAPPAGRLESGSLSLVRPAADGGEAPWRVRLGDSSVAFERGALDLRSDVTATGRTDRYTLLAGAASVRGPFGERPLRTGDPLVVVDGRPQQPSATLAARDDAPGRAAVEQPTREEPSAGTAPATRAGSLAGVVLDPEGAPVERFRLSLLRERSGNEYREAPTRDVRGTDGRFRWDGIAPGRYELFAYAEGLAIASTGVLEVAGAQELEPLRLGVGGTVEGYVIDPATGTPVQDAVVLAERDAPQHFLLFGEVDALWAPIQTRTGPDGGFLLEHVRPGTHRLRVTAPGFQPAWTVPVEVVEGETSSCAAVELTPGGSVVGRVDAADGTPGAGAQLLCVSFRPDLHERMHFGVARAGLDGRYRFDDLPVEPMLIVLVDTTVGRPRVKPVEVAVHEVREVHFESSSAAVRVVGALRDHAGAPVPYRNLALFDRAALEHHAGFGGFEATTTLADGTFAFDEITPGAHVLFSVDAQAEWIRFLRVVDVPDVSPFELDAVCGPGRIDARATSAAGGVRLGAGSALLEVALEGSWWFAGFRDLDPDGSVAFDELPPGRYAVTVYPSTPGLGQQRTQEVVLSQHEPTATVEVALGAGGLVAVEVVDAAGAPVPGALVQLVDEHGRVHGFGELPETDTSGRHVSVGVKTGAYSVRVTRDGLTAAPVRVVCRADQTTTVRVELDRQELQEED